MKSCAKKSCCKSECKSKCKVSCGVKFLFVVGLGLIVYSMFFYKTEVVSMSELNTEAVVVATGDVLTGDLLTGDVNTGSTLTGESDTAVDYDYEAPVITEEDYISYAIRYQLSQQFRLPKQYLPGATRDINNPVMREYLSKNTYAVDMTNVTGGYLVFTMQKPISKAMLNKSIFFAVNGNTKGAINMLEGRIETPSLESWYVFDIADMKVGGYDLDLLKSYTKNNKLVIGAHAGENNNQILSIIFVPKHKRE